MKALRPPKVHDCGAMTVERELVSMAERKRREEDCSNGSHPKPHNGHGSYTWILCMWPRNVRWKLSHTKEANSTG